ncbi:DUF1365 family protein [Streptomyces sp. NPDC059389]|uniref:DUF1365 family protein n=1 Tax=Streptomyces sp. NPDC059389 TaxID=3346818 RepID=UPI0036824795
MLGRTEGTAALYECVIGHARVAPLRHSFRQRTHLWCVDLDRMPVLPRPVRPLARFDARDHFTGGAASIRAGLDALLAARRPWSTVAAWAGIRRQGVRLLLRGLPVHPRPRSTPQEGMPS